MNRVFGLRKFYVCYYERVYLKSFSLHWSDSSRYLNMDTGREIRLKSICDLHWSDSSRYLYLDTGREIQSAIYIFFYFCPSFAKKTSPFMKREITCPLSLKTNVFILFFVLIKLIFKGGEERCQN